MWSLKRWARLRSGLPPETPKVPELVWSQGIAKSHEEKANAFRFFPKVEIQNLSQTEIAPKSLQDVKDITEQDILEVLGNLRP